MTFADVLSRVVTVLALGCALITTAAVVRKEFIGTSGAPSPSQPPVDVKNWKELASVGHRIGPPDPVVTIVEFADFECPSCGRFANGPLLGIRVKFAPQVALVFRHWPLTYHKFAYPAARAADCAAEQDKFEAFHDALFRQQDSLGLKRFTAIAAESGVPDTNLFTSCLAGGGKHFNIERDIAAAIAMKARGTPAVIVNGKYYPGGLDSLRLDSLVTDLLRGK